MVQNYFSVVIPLYNKEKYIRDTVCSVINQTYKNFEIIIVDDGSTDNSLKVVEAIDDDRVHIVKKINEGVSDARNVGILNSNYDWVSFLDADDVWVQTYLFEVNRMINTYPEADIIATDYFINDKASNRDLIVKEGYLNNYFELSFEHYLLHSSSITIRKDKINAIKGFNIGLKSGEDIETWYRLVKHKNKIAYLPKPLSTYQKDDLVEVKRIRNISVDSDWSYHINLKDVSTNDEKKYLLKILASSCIIFLKTKSFKSLSKLCKKQGLLNVLKSMFLLIKYKYKSK